MKKNARREKKRNKGWHNRGDTTWGQVKDMARELGVPFGKVASKGNPLLVKGAPRDEDNSPEVGGDNPSL